VRISGRLDRLTRAAARHAAQRAPAPPPVGLITIIRELRAVFAHGLDALPPEDRAAREAFINLPNRRFVAALRDDLARAGVETGVDWDGIDQQLAAIDRALMSDEFGEWTAR
jgi:hypothetical protein